jgi:predicted small lipoprotein YifL
MFATPRGPQRLWTLCGLVGMIVALDGCGQRGPLYLPDRNARVVTRPAAGSQPEGASPAPAAASAPAPN